jgi:multimeric flavodoxin WrbA
MSSKRIFAINSSPRKEKGNTATLTNAFLEGAMEAGAETQIEYIFGQDIRPCIACYSCWTRTPGECSQKDDMKKMLDKVRESDIIVYSTPLYVWAMTGPMKNFIDRMLPLFNPEARAQLRFCDLRVVSLVK